MVSTESYLLSLAVGRIYTPAAGVPASGLTCSVPASLIFQNRDRLDGVVPVLVGCLPDLPLPQVCPLPA